MLMITACRGSRSLRAMLPTQQEKGAGGGESRALKHVPVLCKTAISMSLMQAA